MRDGVSAGAGVVSAGPEVRNLADVLAIAADRSGDGTALLADSGSLTWRQFDDRVERCAAGLRSLGLAPGDRVLLLLGNTLDFPVAYFGTLRAGLVAVPATPANTGPELRHLLDDSGAAAVVVGPAGLAALQEALRNRPAAPVVLGADGAVPAGGATLHALLEDTVPSTTPASERGGEDLAVLIYTSGTSGRPKGAMLSHRALLADLDHVARIEPAVVRSDDVVLLALPLCHIYGLNTGLGQLVRAAATGVLVDRFDPAPVADVIREHRVTVLLGAPPMYVAWSVLPDVRDAFGSVRLAISGAAPLPAEVALRFERSTGVRIEQGYGLTEAAPSVTSTLCSTEPKPGSIGRPVPGVALQLVDSSGAEVDADDAGEIRVRGENLFSGYWPDGRDGPDSSGWWSTGDVAVADARGDLRLVDRRSEVVLVSGFNVYPAEVEAVLCQHPDVAEAAVIGIPHPYTGEAVKAFVVPMPGRSPSEDELLAHVTGRLARFKCPTVCEVVDRLPRTASGKIAKGRLRGGLGASA